MGQNIKGDDIKKENISYDLTLKGRGLDNFRANVIVVSTDRNIFTEGSAVRQRMVEYGSIAGKMHVVVFSDMKRHGILRLEPGEDSVKISDNVFAYPTNSKSKWFYVWDAIRICEKIIKKHLSKDISNFLISVQDPYETVWVGRSIKKKFKIPLQVQIHTDFMSPFFRKQSVANFIRYIVAKFCINDADGLRVVSGRIKHSLANEFSIYEDKMSVLPVFVDVLKIKNAVVTVNLRQKYPQFDFLILMASRLSEEKNIKMAISAFKEVVKEYPKTGLLIVGSGPEKDRLVKYANASEDLKNSVIFEDAIDFDTLISYYKTASLFLLTSNYEGYGMAVIEAMAAGCPVVMTGVGVAGEYLRHGYSGLSVLPKDTKALEETLLEVLKNPGMLGELAKNAYGGVRDFPTKEEYLEKYKTAWEKCFKKIA